MVNAKKHRLLKVINEITEPERLLVQCRNRKEYYNKTKFKFNAEMKLDKKFSSELESLAYKV